MLLCLGHVWSRHALIEDWRCTAEEIQFVVRARHELAADTQRDLRGPMAENRSAACLLETRPGALLLQGPRSRMS